MILTRQEFNTLRKALAFNGKAAKRIERANTLLQNALIVTVIDLGWRIKPTPRKP